MKYTFCLLNNSSFEKVSGDSMFAIFDTNMTRTLMIFYIWILFDIKESK